jgi:mannose-1-phosphate guanylyltransferase
MDLDATGRYSQPAIGSLASGEAWAIVLAGGDGTRLGELTVDHTGNKVPKQFCSLDGGASLLAQTFARAESIVGRERVTTVVTATHAPYWQDWLPFLPPENVIVQPTNRGTGIGILLPTLRILERDPQATVLILPSDHHIIDEHTLQTSMRVALDEIRRDRKGIALLGINADKADPELGYIVPVRTKGIIHGIKQFVEKPARIEAKRLCRLGALWNSFILVGRAESIVDLFLAKNANMVESVRCADRDYRALVRTYLELPPVDFSRDIVNGQEQRIGVVPVPWCGWSDLGTPQSLARVLTQRRRSTLVIPTAWSKGAKPLVNLAERLFQGDPGAMEDRCARQAG